MMIRSGKKITPRGIFSLVILGFLTLAAASLFKDSKRGDLLSKIKMAGSQLEIRSASADAPTGPPGGSTGCACAACGCESGSGGGGG